MGENNGTITGHVTRSNDQSSTEEHVTTSYVTSDPTRTASADCMGGGKNEALEDGVCAPKEGILGAILADAAGRQNHYTVGAEGNNGPQTGEGGCHVATNSDVVRTRKRNQKWVSRQENKRRKVRSYGNWVCRTDYVLCCSSLLLRDWKTFLSGRPLF